MNRRDSLTITKQRYEKSKRNESGILRASNSQFDVVTQNIPQKSSLNDTNDPLVPTGSRMLISNIYIPSQNNSHSQPSSRTNLNLDSSKENQIGTVIKRKDKKKTKKVPEVNLNERNDASNSQFYVVTQNIPQKSTLNDTTDPLVPTGSRMLISNINIPSQNNSHSQPSSRTNINLDSSKENQIGTVIKRKDKFFRRNILLSLMEKKTHNPLSNKPRPLCLYDFLSLFQKYYLALFTPNIEHIFDSPVNKKSNRTAKKSDRKSKRPNIQHLNVNKVKIPNEYNYKNDSELNYDEIVFPEPGQAYSQCLKMFGKMTKKMRRDFFFGEESFIFVK